MLLTPLPILTIGPIHTYFLLWVRPFLRCKTICIVDIKSGNVFILFNIARKRFTLQTGKQTATLRMHDCYASSNTFSSRRDIIYYVQLCRDSVGSIIEFKRS